MKKSILFVSLVLLFSLNSFAQTPNFSGEWILDKEKSKLDKRQAASIESQILKAEQADKDIKVTVTTKQNPNEMVGENRVDLGGGANTYTLDGKEITVEKDSQIGRVLVKCKGEFKDGKLKLQSSRTFNTPSGDVTINIKEIWELSADGKTLNIKREGESPQGTKTSELVFTKMID